MAAVAIKDDANMTWHWPLFELMKEQALVNPIKKRQEQRSGRDFLRVLSFRSVMTHVESRKDYRARAFVGGLPTGMNLVHPHISVLCLNALARYCVEDFTQAITRGLFAGERARHVALPSFG
jgi:hypothetical protein